MKLSFRYTTFRLGPRAMHRLASRMRYVRAAGGIVAAPDGTLLIIHRNGRWDLPKGKVEAGETLRAAALREVMEETGVCHLEADRLPLLKTYHIYHLYGHWHLKQTSWFRMRSADKPYPRPQREEGITGCHWTSPKEWRRRLTDSFGTLKLVAWTHLPKSRSH